MENCRLIFHLIEKKRISKFPFTKLKEMKVNTLIYPNLYTVKSIYKLLKKINTADFRGPILMGQVKPADEFRLGSSVKGMINTSAIVAIDTQQKSNERRNIYKNFSVRIKSEIIINQYLRI